MRKSVLHIVNKYSAHLKKKRHRGAKIKITAHILPEMVQVRRQWSSTSKVLKGKKKSTQIIYPGKISFKNEREIENFSEQKLRKFIVSRPVLQEMLKFFRQK